MGRDLNTESRFLAPPTESRHWTITSSLDPSNPWKTQKIGVLVRCLYKYFQWRFDIWLKSKRECWVSWTKSFDIDCLNHNWMKDHRFIFMITTKNYCKWDCHLDRGRKEFTHLTTVQSSKTLPNRALLKTSHILNMCERIHCTHTPHFSHLLYMTYWCLRAVNFTLENKINRHKHRSQYWEWN